MSGDPLPLEEMTIYKPMPAQLQKSKQTKTKASSSQSSRPEPEFKESGVARKQRLSLKPKGNASAKESSETSELLYREVDERVQRWIDQSGEKSDFSVVKSFKKEYENMSKGQLDGLVRRHAFSQILDSHIHLFDKQPLPRGEGVFYSTLGKLTMMGRSQLVRAEYVIDSKGSLIHRYLKCIDNRSDLFQTVQQQISEIEFPPLVRSLEKPQKKIVESDLESSVEFDPNFNILNLTDLSNDLKLELFLPELDS